ncbi:DUF6577 family protein [Fusibacter tunisiensis]|uniref:Transcriptional regulator, AbiEi antitoxin, Type IV TA system n=1 Tax=Fusibacter tunisiensis TaxID=1008308 RepID=A0ABS2MNF9_9FIRM|nr:DUF6577 family protein [Fusibacter tunisiensis]MBM7560937.1 hypothetical protein [Fusibacter tunisiensis]
MKEESMKEKNITVEERFFQVISNYFKPNNEMRIQDIYGLFPDVNKKTISWRLYSLVQKGKLEKTGHGIYGFKDEKNMAAGYQYLQNKSKKIFDVLSEYGYDFYITGLDVLVGEVLHIPEQYPVLVVVEENETKAVKKLLDEQGWFALTEKDKNHIIDPVIKSKIDVIILSGKNFDLAYENLALKEKGFIDLYFAVTKLDYLLSINELSRIYESLIRNNSIVMSKMNVSAKDRKIDIEIKWLLELTKYSQSTLEFMENQIMEAKKWK